MAFVAVSLTASEGRFNAANLDIAWHTPTTHAILGRHSALQPNIHTDWLHYCSPWVVLSDFGGAFAMGAIGGGIWHGIKGARNSPRVRIRSSQRKKTLPNEGPAGRTSGGRCVGHQGPRTCYRRELRCMGRHVLDIRLCCQGLSTKRGCMECHHLGVHDWRVSCSAE